MAIALFDPQLVIARLATQVTALKSVAGAADYAAANPDLKAKPAAWVVELANLPARNELATVAVSQRNEIRFGVIIAAQNLRDPRGEHAAADVKALREAIAAALIAWQPGSDYDVCEYAGGRILALEDSILWWQD